jgi:signal transduction histidine kinase
MEGSWGWEWWGKELGEWVLKWIAPIVADDVPRNVIGDSARIMQVFTNLIGNSIKFTSKGRILVRGRLANPESSGQHRRTFSSFSLERLKDAALPDAIVIVFEVDDTGPGIDPGVYLSCSLCLPWNHRITRMRAFPYRLMPQLQLA